MTEFIVGLCTCAGTVITLWGTVIYPRSKEKKKLEAQQEKEEAERNEDIDGIVSAAGEVVIPRLTVRVRAIEGEMKKVTAGQGLLEQRMDEANGTGRATRQAVEEALTLLHDLKNATFAVKEDLGIAAKKVAVEAKQSQVEVLQALVEHEKG